MKASEIKHGDRFGRWAVLSDAVRRHGHRRLLCRCECGTEAEIFSSMLVAGLSKGCKPCAMFTHGMSGSRTYTTWQAMRQRCNNPRHRHYATYGGRGITVCDEWSSFEAFFRDMGESPEGLTLDRIDSNQGYSKENCRWATRMEQSSNLRKNKRITYKGVEYTYAQLARVLGIHRATLRSRIVNGHELDTPVLSQKPNAPKLGVRMRVAPIEDLVSGGV